MFLCGVTKCGITIYVDIPVSEFLPRKQNILATAAWYWFFLPTSCLAILRNLVLLDCLLKWSMQNKDTDQWFWRNLPWIIESNVALRIVSNDTLLHFIYSYIFIGKNSGFLWISLQIDKFTLDRCWLLWPIKHHGFACWKLNRLQ